MSSQITIVCDLSVKFMISSRVWKFLVIEEYPKSDVTN